MYSSIFWDLRPDEKQKMPEFDTVVESLLDFEDDFEEICQFYVSVCSAEMS